MLKINRQQLLLELLEKDSELKVGELARHLGITTMTLHRDLKELEKNNCLKRVHGGAVAVNEQQQPSFQLRKASESMKKQKIAREAVKLLKDNQVIFFDAGTTTLALAEIIPDALKLTAVTTGIQTAAALAGKKNIQVILIGGTVHGSSFSSIGGEAKESIKKLHADIAFISTKAFDADFGTYEAVMELIEIKREMISSSERVILLADSTKLGKKSLSQSVPLSEIDCIISDEGIVKNPEAAKLGSKLIIAV